MSDNRGLFSDVMLFEEKYAMAQSMKNVWTKMVNSWKCVRVQFTETHLQVSLQGLLGLLVKPFAADLEHIVPVSDLVSVEKKGKVLGYGEVEVVFRLDSGGTRTLLLYLKRADEFVNLVVNYVR